MKFAVELADCDSCLEWFEVMTGKFPGNAGITIATNHITEGDIFFYVTIHKTYSDRLAVLLEVYQFSAKLDVHSTFCKIIGQGGFEIMLTT